MSKITIVAISIIINTIFCSVLTETTNNRTSASTPIAVEVPAVTIPEIIAIKPINVEAYAFVDGDNRYGNSLETVEFPYRRMVTNGTKIFAGIDNLFQCNPDGSDRQVIYDQPLNQVGREQIGQISFYDGWVYFSDYCELWTFFESSRLYRIRPDGSCLETIYDSSVNKQGRFLSFQIVNDRIYIDGSYGEIAPDGERFGIRSMSLTGEDVINICDAPAYLSTVSDKVYYSYGRKMYISDLDGSSSQFIAEESDAWYGGHINNGYFYYYDASDKSFYRVELYGGTPQLIISGIKSTPKNVFVKDGYLYFVHSYAVKMDEYADMIKYKLVRTLVTGNGNEELICDDVTRLKHTLLTPVVMGDWIYYHGTGIRKVRLDGSEDILIGDWFD